MSDDDAPYGRGPNAWQPPPPTDDDIAEDYLRRIAADVQTIKYVIALVLFLAGLAGVTRSLGVW